VVAPLGAGRASRPRGRPVRRQAGQTALAVRSRSTCWRRTSISGRGLREASDGAGDVTGRPADRCVVCSTGPPSVLAVAPAAGWARSGCCDVVEPGLSVALDGFLVTVGAVRRSVKDHPLCGQPSHQLDNPGGDCRGCCSRRVPTRTPSAAFPAVRPRWSLRRAVALVTGRGAAAC